jgi:hypothetical protein
MFCLLSHYGQAMKLNPSMERRFLIFTIFRTFSISGNRSVTTPIGKLPENNFLFYSNQPATQQFPLPFFIWHVFRKN